MSEEAIKELVARRDELARALNALAKDATQHGMELRVDSLPMATMDRSTLSHFTIKLIKNL